MKSEQIKTLIAYSVQNNAEAQILGEIAASLVNKKESTNNINRIEKANIAQFFDEKNQKFIDADAFEYFYSIDVININIVKENFILGKFLSSIRNNLNSESSYLSYNRVNYHGNKTNRSYVGKPNLYQNHY